MTAGVAEAVPAAPARWASALGRLDPLLPAAVVLVLCGLVQLRTCVMLVLADYSNLAGEEYNVVYSLERLIGEGVLYTDPARPPFAVVQYGPLYYWIGRGLAGLAGLHAGDALAITRMLRGISFACLLAQIGVVAVILRRHLGDAVAGRRHCRRRAARVPDPLVPGGAARLARDLADDRLDPAGPGGRAGRRGGPARGLARRRARLRGLGDPDQAERIRRGPDRAATRA